MKVCDGNVFWVPEKLQSLTPQPCNGTKKTQYRLIFMIFIMLTSSSGLVTGWEDRYTIVILNRNKSALDILHSPSNVNRVLNISGRIPESIWVNFEDVGELCVVGSCFRELKDSVDVVVGPSNDLGDVIKTVCFHSDFV